jgi:putative hydrolase of the HAD superfamily
VNEIKVVCFDIDGTLYHPSATRRKLLPSLFPNPFLAYRYNKFRKFIRKEKETTRVSTLLEYRLQQAAWIGRTSDPQQMKRIASDIEKQMYNRWKKSFKVLTPFADLRSSLEELRNKGYILAALSDFPVEQKLVTLGVEDLFEVAFCTEESGYLKPHRAPFLNLCERLDVKPHQVVYVGDSCPKDMVGAKRVGMYTILFNEKAKKCRIMESLRKRCPQADTICYSYKQIEETVNTLGR